MAKAYNAAAIRACGGASLRPEHKPSLLAENALRCCSHMLTPSPGLAPALPSGSNQSLLGAALAGLLCLAPAACSGKEGGPNATGAVRTDPPAVAGAGASVGGQTSAGTGGQT